MLEAGSDRTTRADSRTQPNEGSYHADSPPLTVTLLTALLAAFTGAAPAGAATPASPPATQAPETDDGAADKAVIAVPKLAWRVAADLARTAVEICAKQGYSVTAVVVEPSGLKQALIRGDRAHPRSPEIAYRKAFTASAYGDLFGVESTSELIAQHPALAGPLNTVPGVILLAGGVTIRGPVAAQVSTPSALLGGLGVSGAPDGEKDEACAKAALQSMQDRLK